MILRDATPADAVPLAAILQDWIEASDFMPVLHDREKTEAFLEKLIGKGGVRVAEVDDAPAGFLALSDGWITQVYPRPDRRGRGIGAALLGEAQAKGGPLSLWCFQANTAARRFYLRHGFTETLRTDGAENAERLPDIRFDWRCA